MNTPGIPRVYFEHPTGRSETNFEFDFYENLATEAIATLAHLSWAVAKLELSETRHTRARYP